MMQRDGTQGGSGAGAAGEPHMVGGAAGVGDAGDVGGAGSLRDQVEKVLDMIRPAVQSDGGDLELVAVSEDGVVQVRFHGACVGCPSSTMTLQSGIERNLKMHIPGVRAVESVL